MHKAPKMRAAKVLAIQFSILSPTEIKNGSVAHITSHDTYNSNKPIIKGVFDPRMGVLDAAYVCPTDGLGYMQTPGYFGHLELAQPVFYTQFLTHIRKILKCVCFQCSKLKLNKTAHRHALDMDPSDRADYVYNLAKDIKRCGFDTTDGCGCKQPTIAKRNYNSDLIASWPDAKPDEANSTIVITPELTIKIFSRISNDDVYFLGYNPVFSRPEWMICSVLAIPPPAVRPSVKTNGQRQEDDLTSTVINIIKANVELQKHKNNLSNPPSNVSGELLEQFRKSKQSIIDTSATALQYHIGAMFDNNQQSMPQVAQRSGRPYKTIKARLNGKQGRIRQNLMGKRVNFSARSVITPDPNLSITELGIPLQIAKDITKPERVNEFNRAWLQELVRNGPDKHPGAKRVTKEHGDIQIHRDETIRADQADKLRINDVVHRHVMDGDPVIFNRQPTLHRMSMMCHVAKILQVGETFRMNVADTKPYNADFDGDEMNMHMPQDVESEAELLQLAAVPWQIISPANNKSIIGIFQDSLLGAYQLTRGNLPKFTQQQARNLLMAFDRVDVRQLQEKELSNFEILSQILPPLTLHYKLKNFDANGPDDKKMNKTVAILNGTYTSGQLDKQMLGDGSKSMIQRICNDYGNAAAVRFIDNLQNVVTEYMKSSGFSVGISDLVTSQEVKTKIKETIDAQKDQLRQLELQVLNGTFVNTTGMSNQAYFEFTANNILNKVKEASEKIVQDNLHPGNRFMIMLNAGSKGQATNISQMMACVGSQQVENQRISYGFEQRTLPHFKKFDDSAEARGFVANSFISGLNPEEVFFHAMAGRIGIIDTAVKTATTGYVQRRLIKGMEDLKVEYDMTVRNNKFKIVQFCYGDDAFDSVRVEQQHLPLVTFSLEDVYVHFYMATFDEKDWELVFDMKFDRTSILDYNTAVKPVVDSILEQRALMLSAVFMQKRDTPVYLPVAFAHIINNVRGQCKIQNYTRTNMTPMEAWQSIHTNFENNIAPILRNLQQENSLFKAMYYFYLNPNQLLISNNLTQEALDLILAQVNYTYKKAFVAPGEMVGIIAAQSIGEPTTQMTLNTFHYAGVASKSNVTRGLPRLEEIINLSASPKKPSCTVFLPPAEQYNLETANALKHLIEFTSLQAVVNNIQIIFNPVNAEQIQPPEDTELVQNYKAFCLQHQYAPQSLEVGATSPWIIRIELNVDKMASCDISMADIQFALKTQFKEHIDDSVFSDYNAHNLVCRLRIALSTKKTKGSNEVVPLDHSDEVYRLTRLQQNMLQNLILRGITDITHATPRKIPETMILADNGSFVKAPEGMYVLDTTGSNLLELLAVPGLDATRTFSNNITEVLKVLGVEAARQCIMAELMEVISFDGTYINYHHVNLVCDRMAVKCSLVGFQRFGINNDDIGPLSKASFEKTTDEFIKAAVHAEIDNMRGISANIMCGQEGFYGTNSFQVLYDFAKHQQKKVHLECKLPPVNITHFATEVNVTNNAAADAAADAEYDMFA